MTVREVWPATKAAGGGRNDTYDAGERYPVPMDIITARVSTSVFLSRISRGSDCTSCMAAPASLRLSACWPEADVPQRLKADARVDLLKLGQACCDVLGGAGGQPRF